LENEEIKKKVNALQTENEKIKEELQETQKKYEEENVKQKERIKGLFKDSAIVKLDEKKMINDWIDPYNEKNITSELLFRTIVDGDSSTNFHSKCDNKGPTITFIKTSAGKRVGGFTMLSWNSSGSYREDKEASLATFLTLCVDRKLQQSIKRAGRIKNKLMNDSLSLEHIYDQFSFPLKDLLSDNSKNDPLENIIKDEKLKELVESIRTNLSDKEYEVYSLMLSGLKYHEIAILLNRSPKQIDNTIQRLKNKIKKILDER
jgi:DNA-directed RNA polymerase specialized sigma24 family protein